MEVGGAARILWNLPCTRVDPKTIGFIALGLVSLVLTVRQILDQEGCRPDPCLPGGGSPAALSQRGGDGVCRGGAELLELWPRFNRAALPRDRGRLPGRGDYCVDRVANSLGCPVAVGDLLATPEELALGLPKVRGSTIAGSCPIVCRRAISAALRVSGVVCSTSAWITRRRTSTLSAGILSRPPVDHCDAKHQLRCSWRIIPLLTNCL